MGIPIPNTAALVGVPAGSVGRSSVCQTPMVHGAASRALHLSSGPSSACVGCSSQGPRRFLQSQAHVQARFPGRKGGVSPESPRLLGKNSFPKSMCQNPPTPRPTFLASHLLGLSPMLMPKTTNSQGNEVNIIGFDQSSDFEVKANVSTESGLW